MWAMVVVHLVGQLALAEELSDGILIAKRPFEAAHFG
jgi:hypothetical protein